MNNYYRHSGKFGADGLLFGLLAGMLLAIPAAFLYDYAIFEIDAVKLRILCPMGFGALIGAASGGVMYWGKVRNATAAGIVGGVASFFALYISWVAWTLHLLYPAKWVFNLTRPAIHPHSLWQLMVVVNAKGTWGYERGQPTVGTSLWLTWTAEALFVVGFGTLVAVALIKRLPFCERCNAWCTKRLAVYFAPSLQPGQIKALVESQDIGSLEKLPMGNKKRANFRADLHTCGVCHSLTTLSLVQNLPRNNKTLVDKLLVTPEQASAFRNLEMTRSAAVAAPAASPAK